MIMIGGPLMLVRACHVSGLLGFVPRLLQAPMPIAKGPMLLALIACHAFFDYAGQGDFLSKGKNAFSPIPRVPWYQCMFAHCLIQASAVYFITGNWLLGALEFIIHFATDYAKCADRISFNQDQAIHYGCKVLWAVLA